MSPLAAVYTSSPIGFVSIFAQTTKGGNVRKAVEARCAQLFVIGWVLGFACGVIGWVLGFACGVIG